MLNLNKVGRPLARVEGGKYSGHVVSASDQFANDAEEDDGLIREFSQLKIANDRSSSICQTQRRSDPFCISRGRRGRANRPTRENI